MPDNEVPEDEFQRVFGGQATMATDDKIWTSREWRDRADEARARADDVNNPSARATMIRIAKIYDSMAARIERRERDGRTARPTGRDDRPG